MKDISEYSASVPEDELFSFLYDKVVSGEITLFSKLRECAGPAVRDSRTHPVLMKLFELIKRLNWGYFRYITPETHQKLWRELVIQDSLFPGAGDLKRMFNMETSIHICMLDIHGYTKFCQDSRKNPSMLSILDEAINTDIQSIAAQCGAVCNRERGDEIVVVAASATDALTVTLGIFDYFGKTGALEGTGISTKRSGNASILPAFKLSAGITGGDIKTPLVITGQGFLTGFLLNMGARLQSRANELSPSESRIMITKQAAIRFQKENSQKKSPLAGNSALFFLDTGIVEFKGVQILTCEVVYQESERYKEKFSGELQNLFASIKDNLWEQKIFVDMMDLLSRASQVMPAFSVMLEEPVNNIKTIDNASFVTLTRAAITAYVYDEDYARAVALLKEFTGFFDLLPQFDRLIFDYLKGITAKYDTLLSAYREAVDRELEERAAQIFSENNYKAWQAAKHAVSVYEKLKALGRKSQAISQKKALWYSLIKQNPEQMAFTLHSGKK